MSKVPVQKGPIHADVPTMKFMSPEEKVREDAEHRILRHSGQRMEYVSPEKKK